jgi:CsoR family transcriptional regulator, copper-sensing transcriptional repressor
MNYLFFNMMETNSLTDKNFEGSGKEPNFSESKSNLPPEEHTHDRQKEGIPHIHSEESLRQIINRLSRIEGHIRGIKNMVSESRPCPEILIQIAAIRGALDRVSRIILDEHLSECIARAAQEGNIEIEIAQLKAALDRFLP